MKDMIQIFHDQKTAIQPLPKVKLEKYSSADNHEDLFAFVLEYESMMNAAPDALMISQFHCWISASATFKNEICVESQNSPVNCTRAQFRKRILSIAVGGRNPYNAYEKILSNYPPQNPHQHNSLRILLSKDVYVARHHQYIF